MAIVYTQAISTRLTQPVLTTGQTQIEVADISQMPSPLAPGDWFYLTLWDNDNKVYEVTRVTDITGLVLTVDRDLGGSSATFGVQETTVTRWVINLDWEDLRTELQSYAATPQDLLDSIAGLLTEVQIQTLIDAALVPYITSVAAAALIVNFKTEAEIQTLIDDTLVGYTTTAEATTIATNVVDAEVTSRQLVDDTEAQTIVDDAIAAANFLAAVNIGNDGETIGITSGDGTSGTPLKVDWGVSDPDNIANIPANTTHSNATSGNPHNNTALDVDALTTGTPSGAQLGFVPTDDDHPANKKYVDDQVSVVVSTPSIDLTDVGSVTGRVIIGQDTGSPNVKFIRCWQEFTEVAAPNITQGDFTVTFPADNQLDQPPTDMYAILDVTGWSAGEKISAGVDLYVFSTTTTQAVISMDTGGGSVFPAGKDLVIKLGYFGKKTII